MKELTPPIQDKEMTAADERQVATQKLITSWKKQPGHRVWELDLATGLITEAKTETAVHFDIAGPVRHKVVQKPGCLYCSALNATNADKKFAKMVAIYKVHEFLKK